MKGNPLLGIRISHPFPDVSDHIIEAPRIWGLGRDRCGRAAVDDCDFFERPVGRTVGASPGGVLPLMLGRWLDHDAQLLGQKGTEQHGVQQGDGLNRASFSLEV